MERQRRRERGVSRLQVAARSTYGLRQRAWCEMDSDCFIVNSPQDYIAFALICNHVFLFETVSTVCSKLTQTILNIENSLIDMKEPGKICKSMSHLRYMLSSIN